MKNQNLLKNPTKIDHSDLINYDSIYAYENISILYSQKLNDIYISGKTYLDKIKDDNIIQYEDDQYKYVKLNHFKSFPFKVTKILSNNSCTMIKLSQNDRILISCLGFLDNNIVGLDSNEIEKVQENQMYEGFSRLMKKASVIQTCSEHSIVDMELNNKSSIFINNKKQLYINGKSSVFKPNDGMDLLFEQCKILNKYEVTKVSLGQNHYVFLDEYGNVFSMGDNSCGQCGKKTEVSPTDKLNLLNNTSKQLMVPFSIDFESKIVDICTGWDFSIFLDENSSLYICGNNKNKRFLVESQSLISKPEKYSVKVRKVSAGKAFIIFETDDNKLYVSGDELEKFGDPPVTIPVLKEINCTNDAEISTVIYTDKKPKKNLSQRSVASLIESSSKPNTEIQNDIDYVKKVKHSYKEPEENVYLKSNRSNRSNTYTEYSDRDRIDRDKGDRESNNVAYVYKEKDSINFNIPLVKIQRNPSNSLIPNSNRNSSFHSNRMSAIKSNRESEFNAEIDTTDVTRSNYYNHNDNLIFENNECFNDTSHIEMNQHEVSVDSEYTGNFNQNSHPVHNNSNNQDYENEYKYDDFYKKGNNNGYNQSNHVINNNYNHNLVNNSNNKIKNNRYNNEFKYPNDSIVNYDNQNGSYTDYKLKQSNSQRNIYNNNNNSYTNGKQLNLRQNSYSNFSEINRINNNHDYKYNEYNNSLPNYSENHIPNHSEKHNYNINIETNNHNKNKLNHFPIHSNNQTQNYSYSDFNQTDNSNRSSIQNNIYSNNDKLFTATSISNSTMLREKFNYNNFDFVENVNPINTSNNQLKLPLEKISKNNFSSLDTLRSEDIKRDTKEIRLEEDYRLLNEKYQQEIERKNKYQTDLNEMLETFEKFSEILEKYKISNLIKVYGREKDLEDPIQRAFNKYNQVMVKCEEVSCIYVNTELYGVFSSMQKMLDRKVKDNYMFLKLIYMKYKKVGELEEYLKNNKHM